MCLRSSKAFEDLSCNSALGSKMGFPCVSTGKESACNVGDLGSIPELERSPGEGKGYPLQYCGLENSMDCIVHGVAKSWTRLSDFHFHLGVRWGFPGGSEVKNLPVIAGEHRRRRFDRWVEKTLWRRQWQPTPVFLAWESHGQRSLEGKSPWGCKESDTPERLTTSAATNSIISRLSSCLDEL